MNSGTPPPSRFLVEWYCPALADEILERNIARLISRATASTAEGFHVELLATVAVPADELVFAVFDAVSANVVADVCCQAGVPVQRLTTAVDARCWAKDAAVPAADAKGANSR